MAAHANNTLRGDEYSQRLPTPPRIVVPPPSANINLAPEFNLQPIAQSGPLSAVAYDQMATSSLLDWSYERRREAQQVIPFLYLGPSVAAKDRDFLRNEAITLVLAVRQRHSFQSKIMDAALRVAESTHIQTDTLDVSSQAELVASFPKVAQIINGHMNTHQSGKVLVICESGSDRSAAVVAAYLMEVLANVDHIKAMQIVQAQRFCVNFDDNVKRLLQSYWDLVKAKRDLGNSSTSTTAKRVRERDMDVDNMDLDEDDPDAERFQNRVFAPFVDMAL